MSIGSYSRRGVVFAGFTVLVCLSTLVEVAVEFGEGEMLRDMVDDIALFLLSSGILVLFCYDYLQQQRALSELRQQMNGMRGKLEKLDTDTLQITTQFRAIMQKQFSEWRLTESEQDIARALIKGLSFREVAELRETREKTVRQQAAAVYRKAGLTGRHELAGWFFEDLLNPSLDSAPNSSPNSSH